MSFRTTCVECDVSEFILHIVDAETNSAWQNILDNLFYLKLKSQNYLVINLFIRFTKSAGSVSSAPPTSNAWSSSTEETSEI